MTAVGLRKVLRAENMLLDEGLVEVWGNLVRVAGGVLVGLPEKTRPGMKVEGEEGLYALLVEGQGKRE